MFTQKKAPQVPLTFDIFIPTRKLPYKISVRCAAISAAGIKPSASFLTHSCNPASPPLTLAPAHEKGSLSGFETTFASLNSLPYGPLASLGVTLYCCGVQRSSVGLAAWRKSFSKRSVKTSKEASEVRLTE
jgi:hypothetical protein